MNNVSVVIPAYNHQNYIGSAIESVINQTLQPDEIIIIDDGSSDETSQICRSYADKYPQINFIRQENMGAHNTINKGIGLAKGKYIAILNSDDVFLKNKIKRCVEICEKYKDVELVFGKFKFINAHGSKKVDSYYNDWIKKALNFYKKCNSLEIAILNENFAITTSNMFFTKDIWEKVGKFQNLRYSHDLDFILSCMEVSKCYYDSKKDHIYYRVHNKNTIKENINKVRVEVAAIIGRFTSSELFNPLNQGINENQFRYMQKLSDLFLNRKDIAHAVQVFEMISKNFKKKTDYYDFIMRNKEDLMKAFFKEQ